MNEVRLAVHCSECDVGTEAILRKGFMDTPKAKAGRFEKKFFIDIQLECGHKTHDIVYEYVDGPTLFLLYDEVYNLQQKHKEMEAKFVKLCSEESFLRREINSHKNTLVDIVEGMVLKRKEDD
jgi:hypothetical protein